MRYLYSCLTDADFLDTEKFVMGKERDAEHADFLECETKLQEKFSKFQALTPLQKARTSLKSQALKNLQTASGHIFLVDMPTGSGKTLCSVQLALEKLRETHKKRIIYVIPYTSIIEQTANTLHNIFPNLTILEHHSNFDFDEEENMSKAKNMASDGEVSASEKLKKSAENWDVPFVITTNVQFFESIYSSRVSKLRKFHNMCDSVIVFDEIHMLPLKNFVQCIRAVKSLAEDFGSEIFLLTATMPDFPKLCEKFAKTKLDAYDLLPNKAEYQLFDKCTFEFFEDKDIDIIEHINRQKSTLVVSNSKRGALELYNRYEGEKFYLSTYMAPLHRLYVIDKIRKKLANGDKIVIFSTSLIEAGVDLDFDEVWREIAGADNILQTAGRCNREGQKDKAESKVYIFCTNDKLQGELDTKAEITKGLINKYGANDLSREDCVKAYFDMLYTACEFEIDKEKRATSLCDVDFKTIAKDFKMIDDDRTFSVVVPLKLCDILKDEEASEEIKAKIEDINAEIAKLKACGFANRRKLQKVCATVKIWEAEKLIESGVVRDYDGVLVLESDEFYSREIGLDTSSALNKDLIY